MICIFQIRLSMNFAGITYYESWWRHDDENIGSTIYWNVRISLLYYEKKKIQIIYDEKKIEVFSGSRTPGLEHGSLEC